MAKVNKELANIFRSAADLMEIRGLKDDFYPVRAYRSVALIMESEERDFSQLSRKELEGISGIGKAISEKVLEYVKTGKIAAFESLKQDLPKGLPKLLEIPGLGPKYAKLFWHELDITTVVKLKAALQKGVIAELPGFGEKSAKKLLDAIEGFTGSDRIPREKVLPLSKKVVRTLKKISCASDVLVAGSLRRGKATVHDIDILVASKKPVACAKEIAKQRFWGRMIGQGETKVSGVVDDVQVDVRIVDPKSFGAAALYFTGSKGFNIYLRKIAIARRLKLNEYGLFDAEGKSLAGEDEKGIFKELGIEYLDPKQRDAF